MADPPVLGAQASPFHPDELVAQGRAGGGAAGAGIRSFMPDQHRSFFAQLRYVLVGTVDADGWPVATMLTGAPGFVHSPDAVTLRIDALPGADDPAVCGLAPGRDIGVLGIDFGTQRRNRANGKIVSVDGVSLTVAILQSFGNCPRYIQRRSVRTDGPMGIESGPCATVEPLVSLDEARALIRGADTFLIASRSRHSGRAGGADISHRGGRPGFVHVEGATLSIPDFPGNRYFNTFGNLLGEPRAALLFIDFDRGDLLQLQGTAQIDWRDGVGALPEGAERMWCVSVVRGWRHRAASRLRWSFVDCSESSLRTGIWTAPLAARAMPVAIDPP